MLSQQSLEELVGAIYQSGNNVNIENIRLFTQRGVYTRRILEDLGIEQFEKQLFNGTQQGMISETEHAYFLKRKSNLIDLVTDYVDRQLELYTANSAQNLREEILERSPLSRIERRDFKIMKE